MPYLGNTPTTQSFISGTDYFNGTGSQTAFTLTRTVVSQNDIEAVVNNVIQQPNAGYTVSGTTITFTSAPSAGTQNVYVRYLSTTTQAITPSQGTVSWSTLNSDVQQDLGISFKNRIINGAMQIDQRNNGASTTINSGASTYTLDRWLASGTASAGVFTVVQSTSTPPANFSNFLRTTVTTIDSSLAATDFYGVSQRIEGFNIADLNWGSANARTVTLSFWVRSSLTGTFTGALNATTASTASYVFSYTINAANTWEQKSVTIPGPTIGTFNSTNGIGLGLWFMLALGSTYTGSANAWTASAIYGVSGATNVMATNGATFDITGVMLEVGTQATTFTTAGGSYGAELALCQRYYQAFQVTSDWGNASGYGMAAGTYLTEMRAVPTATYTPSSGSILATSMASRTYQFQIQSLSAGSASSATATFSIEL
jgi:hypothetical protein